jgi:hypothetical protein
MGPIGAAIGAIQRMMRDLSELSRSVRRPTHAEAPRPGKPVAFVRYVDDGRRFEFSYPEGWTLQTHAGVHAYSPRIGSFVRVDALPAADDPWPELTRLFDEAGLAPIVDRSSPTHLRGRLTMPPLRFAWTARFYARGDESVILSLGNVVDASRGAQLEAYEDRVLSAIRRSFRVHRVAQS